MSLSNSTITTSNMELSPMRVTFGGTDLGGTLGNVSVKMQYQKAEIKADQSGETVRDRRVSGFVCQVTTEIAEVQNLDNWKVVFPNMLEVSSGGNKGGYFAAAIGDSDLAHAGILLLHPLSKADADLSEDFKFYKACASAESEIIYGPKDQAKLKIVWNILPDTTTVPDRFFFHGDPSLGLVAATAGTPSYSGTGNGTIGSVTAYSGFTITETITVKCVTAAANGGVFSVTGSVSGVFGIATVGISFVSSKISFTIADGGTDFIVGDQWTIAMTAANYA